MFMELFLRWAMGLFFLLPTCVQGHAKYASVSPA